MDDVLAKAMADYGLSDDAVWKHKQSGQTIIKHWAVEHMAIKARVQWQEPRVIVADSANKMAVVLVSAKLGDREEWSFGEAAPYNTQQSYVFAMAEKRGKDRVVLKLLGLHGRVYSEEEADDFVQPKQGTGAAISGPIANLAPKDDQVDMLALDWFDGSGEKVRTIRGAEAFMRELYEAAQKVPSLFGSNEHTLAWLEKEYPAAKCGKKTVAAAARAIRLAYDAQGATV